MLGLPDSTVREKRLDKSEFFAHFGMKGRERAQLDAEVSRMYFAAHVSPDTVPAWPKEGRGIWVLRLLLKRREVSDATIALLAANIKQRLVFVGEFGDEVKLAVRWRRLSSTEWLRADEAKVTLRRNVEETWLGIIADIAGLKPGREDELEAQSAEREQRERTLAEIARLEKACARERQMRRRHEIFNQIQQLKNTLKDKDKDNEHKGGEGQAAEDGDKGCYG